MAKTFDDSDFADAVPAKTFTDDDFVQPSSWLRRNVADPAIAAVKGLIGVPETVVGLADLSPAVVLGTKAYKAAFGSDKDKETGDFGLVGRVVQSTGLDFKKAKTILDSMLSPEQQADDRYFRESVGFFNKVKAAIQRPAIIAQGAIESAPTMLTGAALARTVMAVAPKVAPLVAAAIGESLVTYGQNAEGVRQESAGGMMTGKQVGTMGASSAATGLLGFMGGKAASKLGIADVDVLLGTGTSATGKKNVARRVIEGMLSEGVLEELPQSTQEQIAQNLASGKKWDEGVLDAAVQGMMSGMAMGGAANVFGGNPKTLEAWASANPEAAAALAAKEAPSRKDFESAGLPRASAQDRAATAEVLRGLDLSMPDPTAVQETPAQPLTVDGKEMKPGDTVPAGQHEIDGKTVLMSAATPVEDVQAMMQQEADASTAEFKHGLEEDSYVRDLLGKESAPFLDGSKKVFRGTGEDDVSKKKTQNGMTFFTDGLGVAKAYASRLSKNGRGTLVSGQLAGHYFDLTDQGNIYRLRTDIRKRGLGAGLTEQDVSDAVKVLESDDLYIFDTTNKKEYDSGWNAIQRYFSNPVFGEGIKGVVFLDQHFDAGGYSKTYAKFDKSPVLENKIESASPVQEAHVEPQGEVAAEPVPVAAPEAAPKKKIGRKGVKKALPAEQAVEASQPAEKESIPVASKAEAEAPAGPTAPAAERPATPAAEGKAAELMTPGKGEVGPQTEDSYRDVDPNTLPWEESARIVRDEYGWAMVQDGEEIARDQNPEELARSAMEMNAGYHIAIRATDNPNEFVVQTAEHDLEDKLFYDLMPLKKAKELTASPTAPTTPPYRDAADAQAAQEPGEAPAKNKGLKEPAEATEQRRIFSEQQDRMPAWMEANGMLVRKGKQVRTQAAEDKLRAEGWQSYGWTPGKDAPAPHPLGTLWAKPKPAKNKGRKAKPAVASAAPATDEKGRTPAEVERLKKIATPPVASDKPLFPAAVKVETAPDGDKTLSVPAKDKPGLPPKEQKKWLLAEIDKAIEGADDTELDPGPSELKGSATEQMRAEWRGKVEAAFKRNKGAIGYVTIEVPGDGTFEVWNTKAALRKLKERVSKAFPVSEFKRTDSKPSSSPSGLPAASKGKAVTTAEADAMVRDIASEDPKRKDISETMHDPETGVVWATDGVRIHAVVVADKASMKTKGGQILTRYRDLAGTGKDGTPSEVGAAVTDFETETLLRKLRQAKATLTKDERIVTLIATEDGGLEVATETRAGKVEEGWQGGGYTSVPADKLARNVGMFNADRLEDAIAFIRKSGGGMARIVFRDPGAPLAIKSGNAWAVLMPARIAGAVETSAKGLAAMWSQSDPSLKSKARKRAEIDEGAPLPAGVGAARKVKEPTYTNPMRKVDGSLSGMPDEELRSLGPASQERAQEILITEAVLRAPNGTYLLNTTGRSAPSLRQHVSQFLGYDVGREQLERIVRGLSTLHPEAVNGMFTLGLEQVRLSNQIVPTDIDPDAPLPSGVGAARAANPQEFFGDAVGVKHAYTEARRAQLGLPPRTARQAVQDEALAEQANAMTPAARRDRIAEFVADPKLVPSDLDAAIFAHEIVDAETALNDAKNDAGVESANVRLDALYSVVERAGSEAGAALRARRFMMDADYNIGRMEWKLKKDQGGKPLSTDQKADVARIKAEYDAKMGKLDKEVARLQAEQGKTEELLKNAYAEVKYAEAAAAILAEPGRKASPVRQRMLSWADRMEAEAMASIRARAGRASSIGADPTVLVDMSKLGAAYLTRGVVKLADWTAKMRSVFTDATDEDLRKALEMAQAAAEAEKAKAATEERAETREKRKSSQDGKKGDITKEIKALFRDEIEAGVDTLETALANVHAIVIESYPDMTPEQVRDEFSGYGRKFEMNRTETDKIIAQLRREAQLQASLDDVAESTAPKRSGPQREKPSQRNRELERLLRIRMKEAGIITRDRESQRASALDAIKTRLLNSIADIEKAIATNTRIVADKGIGVEYDAKAQTLKAQRDSLRERYDELFPKEPITDEQRLKIALKQAERLADSWAQREKDARSGKFTGSAAPTSQPWSSALSDLRVKAEASKAEVASLREIAFPKRTAEQVAIDNTKKRYERGIKDMRRRIKDNDFAPRKRPPAVDISKDPEAMKAAVEFALVKLDYEQLREKARLDARSTPEKIKDAALALMDAQRNVLASYDVSAVGRQGWYLALSHPLLALRATAAMSLSMTQERSAQIAQSLRERKNWALYKKYDLVVDDDGTGNFSHVEDRFKLKLLDAVPGINLSNRTYATFLNVLRADVFDQMLANSRDPSDVSEAKVKALADGINTMSGKGELSFFGKKVDAETAAHFFWAPRFFMSSLDILTFRPLRTGTAETRIAFAKTYARAAVSTALLYTLAGLFRGDDDEPIEWDPRSSDFGAIPFGNHKVGLLGFVRPLLTFAARVLSGQSKSGGEVRNLRASMLPLASEAQKITGVPYGSGMGNTVGRFLQSKAHPTCGVLLSAITGKDFGNNDITAVGVVQDLTMPLALREALQSVAIDDPDAAAVATILTMFGVSVGPDYQSPELSSYQAGKKAVSDIVTDPVTDLVNKIRGRKIFKREEPSFDARREKLFNKEAADTLDAATDPSATDGQKATAVKFVEYMGTDAARDALRESKRNAGESVRAWEGNKRTAFGERLGRFSELARMAEAGERPATAPEAKSKLEIGSALWKAANKPDDEGMREIAVRMLSKMKVDEARAAFAANAKRSGMKPVSWNGDKKTKYGVKKDYLERMIKESGAK